MSNAGQHYDPIAHVATLQQTLAAVTKERDDWKRDAVEYESQVKLLARDAEIRADEFRASVEAISKIRDAAVARAETAEKEREELAEHWSTNYYTLRAELSEAKRTIEKSCHDWAEDDTEIKRLAESAGIQGESKDDNFRSAVDVVADLVAALSEAKRDKERLDWVLRNVPGSAWASLGIFYSDGCRRKHVDKAIDAATEAAS